MKYYVYDAHYEADKGANALYGTNKKREAIKVADDIGAGAVVIYRDESAERRVYLAPHKADLGVLQ